MTESTICDWLTGIGTVAMAFFALIAYLKSIHDKDAKIIFDLVVKKTKKINDLEYKLWCLRICNIGERAAKDVKINFDKSFIDNLPLDNRYCKINNIIDRPLYIRAGVELLYILCPLRDDYPHFLEFSESISKWLQIYRNCPINIYYSHSDNWSRECESLYLDQFDTDNIISLVD